MGRRKKGEQKVEKEQEGKKLVKIGKIAQLVGMFPSRVRYYSVIGLLPPDGWTKGGFRVFDPEKAVERLKIIEELLQQRYNLDEIKKILDKVVEERKSKRVLIVDDDKDVVDMITAALSESKSLKTMVAYDGFEAGRIISEFLPHVLVLDLILPGIDGFKICSMLKNEPKFKEIKILAITGYDTPEHRDKIKEAGVDDYLVKPFTAEEIRERIFRLLGISQ
jgi:CheY-like chemotaxis protein